MLYLDDCESLVLLWRQDAQARYHQAHRSGSEERRREHLTQARRFLHLANQMQALLAEGMELISRPVVTNTKNHTTVMKKPKNKVRCIKLNITEY